MKPRTIVPGVEMLGAIDWDRRLFDSLIPLPEGTSYNAYLVRGSEKSALLDTVDPAMVRVLEDQLRDQEPVDYVVAHHAEQDHSGSLPFVLERYPAAKVVTSPKGKGMLIDLLHIAEDRFITVADGETISLGDRTLRFIHTPWVHWAETMVTWLESDRILFTCDFFGSHLASGEMYATDQGRVLNAAKRYYAEIMMPFRTIIEKNLEKIKDLDIAFIAPSHGPVYNRPGLILDAYREWVSGPPRNLVVLPFISMHGSTGMMVDHLVDALVERGVGVERFDLIATDLGMLAAALVDAATIVIGTPTVLFGPHPHAVMAAYLANALKPKVKFASVIGSYGWGEKAVEHLAGMISGLKAEILEPVVWKGKPTAAVMTALERLADTIRDRHRQSGLI